MAEATRQRIDRLEVTEDTLTSRGGLAFFVQYVQAIGVLPLLLTKFAGLKKTNKGVSVENLLRQILYFFLDGSSRHLNYFDDLRKDDGYRAVVEMPEGEMASSHAVKRFFRAFHLFHATVFRHILRAMFVWRLNLNKPGVVMLTLDTMVMDNDEALKREGCDPTYKKVKGFQPLQMIWEGKIVDAIFRRGKRHSNYGNHVEKMLREVVALIRSRYNAGVSIVLRVDSGFHDQKVFNVCDDLGIAFIATGKMSKDVKELVGAIPEEDWKEYANERQSWSYASFSYKCKSWEKAYRALYTRPKYDGEQQILDFARPDNIILTNLAKGEPVLEKFSADERKYWLDDKTLMFHHHMRGADELPHRGLKDFGSEELPFKRFASNQAFYYFMLIGFFLFVCFKEDNLKDILPISSYATTVRRRLIDIAGKVVRTGGQVILKLTRAVIEGLQLPSLWERCQNAPPIPIPDPALT